MQTLKLILKLFFDYLVVFVTYKLAVSSTDYIVSLSLPFVWFVYLILVQLFTLWHVCSAFLCLSFFF